MRIYGIEVEVFFGRFSVDNDKWNGCISLTICRTHHYLRSTICNRYFDSLRILGHDLNHPILSCLSVFAGCIIILQHCNLLDLLRID